MVKNIIHNNLNDLRNISMETFGCSFCETPCIITFSTEILHINVKVIVKTMREKNYKFQQEYRKNENNFL